ncbi:hypothetical protein PSENEW3_00005500 [Picochlorum sp. SENEW3]|nr:hypothetical protein PSENEW3_00005500 [Picochlorum sp. SENEW3]
MSNHSIVDQIQGAGMDWHGVVHPSEFNNDKIMASYPNDGRDETMVTVNVSTKTPQKKFENKRQKVGFKYFSARALSFEEEDTECLERSKADAKSKIRIENAARFDSVLRSQLVMWTEKLLQLQPKVHMSPHIMECGLCLFKQLRKKQLKSWSQGKLPDSYISNRDLMIHDLVACWWIAMKHCSVRTAVPNRTLLSRATDSKSLLLSDCELSALIAMDWNVNHILERHGLVTCSE